MIDRNRLGQRIRDVRTRQKLTLKDVEAASGFSATHVSEIERGRTSPTIGALLRIASALGKDPNFFIEEDELDAMAVSRGRVTTALADASSPSAFEPLTDGVVGGRFRSYLLTITAEKPIRINAETGEACGYVLSGTVELALDDEALQLDPGEAFHCRLGGEHSLRNVGGDHAARVVMIIHRSSAG